MLSSKDHLKTSSLLHVCAIKTLLWQIKFNSVINASVCYEECVKAFISMAHETCRQSIIV